MGYRKFKIIIAMILTLTISVGINAYALQKIEIVPAKYDTGAPATTLSNGSSVSMTSGKQVGYKVYFAESPSTLKIRLGCYAKSQATIEVWLDGVDTGVKIGTVVTEPTTAWTTLEYEIPFNTEAKGEHMLYVKSKKGTCDFVGISIVINEAGDVYPAFSENSSFSNIADENIRHKLGILSDLGLVDENRDFNPDEFITRREYIRLLNKLYDESIGLGTVTFEDVLMDDADLNAISNLYARGILKGTNGTKLEVDRFITPDEMLRMSLRAMGYEYAELIGENIAVTARKAEILNGMKFSQDAVRRGEMINLLYNMLIGTAMERKITGDESSSYTEREGVLSLTKGVCFGTGVVSDNGITNIYDVNSEIKIGNVTIGNERFAVGKTDAANYVGMNCLYFYREIDKSGNKELLSITVYKNTEYTIVETKDTEILEIGDRKVSYYDENDKEKKLNLSGATTFVVNGKAIDSDLKDIIPDISEFRGKLIMIDNDNNGIIDVVLIESYVTMVFGGVSENEIYDSLSEERYPIYNKANVLIYINGTRVDWTDIPENAVIDVYQSKNKAGDSIERIMVSTDTVSGTVTKNLSGAKAKVIIDENEYTVYSKSKQLPPLGVAINAYLNSAGEIVWFEKTETDVELGYLFRIVQLNKFRGPRFIVELLAADNSVQRLEFAKRATIDGVRITDFDELANRETPFFETKYTEGKPVLYMTDADGKISYLDTTKKVADNEQDNLTEQFDKKSVNNKSVGLIEVGGNSLVSVFGSNKKVITIWNTGEKELCAIGTSLTAGNTSNITCSAYTTKKDSFLTDVVIWYDKNVGNHKADFVLSSVTKKLNDEGDVTYSLSGFTGSAEVEYDVNRYILDSEAETGITYESLINSLRKGDLLSVGVNANEKVEAIKVIMFVDGESQNSIGVSASVSKTTAKESVYSRGKTTHGKVVGIEEGVVKLEKIEPDENGNITGVNEIEFIPCSKAKLVRIDESGNRVWISYNHGIEQIMVGDHIVVSTNTESYSAASVFLYDNISWPN